MPRKAPVSFRKAREQMQARARDLIRMRPKLPKHARRFASAMAEQIFQIETEADLERLRPYMAYERNRLEQALRTPSDEEK